MKIGTQDTKGLFNAAAVWNYLVRLVLVILCFGLLSNAQAVNPPPRGRLSRGEHS